VTTSAEAAATSRLTALVVEDEAVVAEANALYLQRLGLEVVGVARSGRDALRLLAANQDLPKGLSVEMLGRITAVLQRADPRSASEVADEIGLSRVTARRCLEYLADSALADRRTSHEGRAGRPEVRYRWR